MSHERKFCWQLDFLSDPTACFKVVGNTPCEEDGCSVDDEIDRRLASDDADVRTNIRDLCHYYCRLSFMYPNPQEFLNRLGMIEEQKES